ncbi:unnamed protein product [Closterium sp. NIES-54]
MAELNLATLTQEQLDRLMRQLEDSALKIVTLTAERDSALQQSTVNAPAPTHAPAQSEEPIVISSGTPTQNDSVGQRSGVASDGAAQSMPGMERNRAAPSTQGPREARRHVEFAATSGNNDIMAPMPLKPQRPPCFDPSQCGGPTVQSWVFTMNVFFDANYVESDAAKIRYAVSLLRGPAMDWCEPPVQPRAPPLAALSPPLQQCAPPLAARPPLLGPQAAPPAACAPPLAAHLPPLAAACPVPCAAMASLCVLTFDHEGRPIQFDTWLDDLQLYLLSDSRDSISLFDHMSGASPAPPATAESATRSQWLTLIAHSANGRGVVVGAAVEVVEAVEVVTVVRVVAGVGALVAAVVAAVGVAVVAAVGVVAVGLELLRREVLAVARGSSSSVGERPRRPSSFVSGFLSVGHLGRAEFGDEAEHPRWAELLRSGVAIFDLDYDAILAALYALSVSAEGDCYLCVPPDPGIEAAALGASECALSCTAPAEALHTFTLDSGASHRFFRDSTTLPPLSAPVPVRLADPSGGPVLARSSTVLPCPAVLSGSLSGLHLPSFSTNLVSTAALQDAMVTTTTPGGQRVSICMCIRTGRHLATFTRRPGSSLYTLATEPPQVAAFAQVSALGQVAPPCSCRLLSHQTLLWHHRLGHPSLPRLRGMHSRLLVSGLPRSVPPLPPSPTLPCLPYVEVRQRAAPHSSSFPPTTAPLQTLHMDVWSPARISGQGRERYFLLVVDDYMRYTMDFPLRSKGEVPDVLIPWIRAVRLQLRERFRADLPVLRLHSDRGGEFSSDLLREFCRGDGILKSFTLPASPQQNGIAERRIGLVMEVARTSMIHTSPTLHWTGKVGDASVFRVWGSRAFVRDTSADKLSTRATPCVFLGFPLDAHGWQFYHPTSRRVFPSQDVTFDESVPFYRLFPYCSTPPPPPPLFLAPGPPPVDPLPPQGPAPSGVSQVDPLPGTVPVEVADGSGAARGATSGGAASGGAEPGGAEPGGAEPGVAEPAGVVLGGGEPEDSAAGNTGAGGVGVIRLGGAGVTAGAGGTGGATSADPGGPGTGGAGAGGARAGDTGAVDPGGGGAGAKGAVSGGAGAGGTVWPRPYFVPLLQQPASSLPAPSPYTEKTGGLTERCKPVSRLALPVRAIRTGRRVPHPRPPPVPGTQAMALRPSSVPLRVPLPAPPGSSLPIVPDIESDLAHAASPTVSHLLATIVTDPSFESPAASALVAELVDFAAACRLDYATALVAESESARLTSVGGECALGTDVFEDRQEDFECLATLVPRFASMLLAPKGDPDAPDIPTSRSYAEAITYPYSSQWQTAMDAEMASWKSTGNSVDAVPLSGANIVDGMWIFRVKRPPGSPPAFKARYVARGFSQ